jgi:hypothetical protein
MVKLETDLNKSPNCSYLSASQKEDIRLAASKMSGATRRAYQAEMVEKYCKGNARLAERVFGWNRHTVETGLGERRTGILCLSAKSVFSGKPRWEEKQPDAAEALCKIAEEYAQQDPTFKSTIR